MAPRQTKAQRELAALEGRLSARRLEAYELYLSGWTQARIAAKFGIDQSTVSADLAKHRASIPMPDREAIKRDHHERLQSIRESMTELVRMAGAPVTAGKDGYVVTDPDTGAVVRDYSLRIAATDRLLKALEREAKHVGIDADAKVVVSGEVHVIGSVDDELNELAAQLGLNDAVDPSRSHATGLTEAP